MKKITEVFQVIFFKLGERSALILVVIVSLLLIYSETASQAYSQEQTISFQRADTKWYEQGKERTIPVAKEEEFSYIFTTMQVTPTPSPTPIPVDKSDVWDMLALCESKGNWGINTGNGYYGGLQFTEGAWKSVGGSGLPHEYSRDEQIMRGKMLQEKRGWGPWGGCSKKLGLL